MFRTQCFRSTLCSILVFLCLVNSSTQEDVQDNDMKLMETIENLLDSKLSNMCDKVGAMVNMLVDINRKVNKIEGKTQVLQQKFTQNLQSTENGKTLQEQTLKELKDLKENMFEEIPALNSKVENLENKIQNLEQKSTQNLQSTQIGKTLQGQTLNELKDLKGKMFEEIQEVKVKIENIHNKTQDPEQKSSQSIQSTENMKTLQEQTLRELQDLEQKSSQSIQSTENMKTLQEQTLRELQDLKGSMLALMFEESQALQKDVASFEDMTGCEILEYSFGIFKKIADGNTAAPRSPNLSDKDCPGEFFRLGSECFLVVSNKFSWEEARTNCQLMGSDLAQPRDIATLRSYLEESGIALWYWIGGSDIDNEGTWKWLDGTEITDGWASDNPNDQYDDENCLIFTAEQVPKSLHDWRCPRSYKSICEI